MKKQILSDDFLKSVPHAPGVYLMEDSQQDVLYVGKAKDLRNRLSSYRRHLGEQNKTGIMLTRLHQIRTIITRTEKDALILEASLIKKHKPKYNVILRDDKNYPLLKVTVNETWPRLMMSRRKTRDGARYFGPFSSTSAMWDTMKLLQSLFPLRKCRGAGLKKRLRPCLNYQIGRCLAPCCKNVDEQVYQQNVHDIIRVLQGSNQEVINDLRKRMKAASKRLDFEGAALVRDRIKALEETIEKQTIVSSHHRDQDVFGYVRKGASVAIAVLTVRSGVLSGSRSYYLATPVGSDAEVLSEVLHRYYDSEVHAIPHQILVPHQPLDMDLLIEWLSDGRDRQVSASIPERGAPLQLLKMARDNAGKVFDDKDKKATSWAALAAALRDTLDLRCDPVAIECLDISNISGQQAVGALVSFVEGEKYPKGYRHYRIKKGSGPDDYGMMREVLERRFARFASDAAQSHSERRHGPDLFMVDGGKGQLHVAMDVLQSLGLEGAIELVGIAKEREGEGEKLYRPGRKNPLLLPRHSPVLLYLMRIRDESHRYGITFHRKLRRKKTLASALDEIPGVGPSRKQILLQHLGSLKRIRSASKDELQAVPGIGPDLAAIIDQYFKDHS